MSKSIVRLGAWTLIELCVVMAIFIILLMAAVPGWQRLEADKAFERYQSLLQHALDFTRFLAVTNHQAYLICPINQDWAKGINVIKADKQGCQTTMSLRQWAFYHNHGLHIQWQGFKQTNHLQFNNEPDNWSANGRFKITFPSGRQKEIIINRFGKIRYCS